VSEIASASARFRNHCPIGGKGRPFCFLKEEPVFFYEFREQGGHRTWIYDIQENASAISSRHGSHLRIRGRCLSPDQDAVFAIIGKGINGILQEQTWER